MKFFGLIFLSFVFVAGCMQIRTKRSPASIILGQALSPVAQLDNEEQSLAYNVCMSLRSKNVLFRAEKNGKKFYFDLEHKNCEGKSFATTLETVLAVKSDKLPLEWQSSVSKFFRLVETHEQGIMAGICPGILQGKGASNTYILDANTKIQVEFKVIDNHLIRVSARSARSNVGSEAIVFKMDEIDFVVGPGPDNTYLGMEKNHSQQIPCPNGGTESLTQTYIHD